MTYKFNLINSIVLVVFGLWGYSVEDLYSPNSCILWVSIVITLQRSKK